MGAKVILVNATHEQNTDMGRRAQVSSTDPVRPLPRHVQRGGAVGAWAPAPFPLDAKSALLSRQFFIFFCN